MSDTPTSNLDGAADEAIPVAEFEPATAGTRSGTSRTRRVVTAAVLTSMLAGAGAIAIVANNGDSNKATKKEARKLAKLKLRSGAVPTANLSGANDESLKRSAMPYQNFEYDHTGAWPELAKSAKVYKINASQVDQTLAQRITDAVGIKGTVKREQLGWSAHDTNLSININESPGSGTSVSIFKYFDDGELVKPGAVSGGSAGASGSEPTPPIEPDRPIASRTTYAAPPAPKNLPSEAEAQRIAQELLTAMGVNETFEIEVLDGSSFATAVSCPSNISCPEPEIAPAVIYSRSVMFHRVVDGHRVNGLDWSIEVGDNGTISSVFGVMADLEVVDTYPLRPVDAVYDDLKNGKALFGGGVIAMDARGAAEVSVDTAIPPASVATDAGQASPNEGPVPTDGPTVNPVVPTPEPIDIPVQRVNVTTAAVGYQLWYGSDAGAEVAYIVPTYTFSGTTSGGYEGPWSTDVIALDPSFIDASATPVPTPVPLGRGDDGVDTPGTDVSPGTDGAGSPANPVEEPVVIPTTPPGDVPTSTAPAATTAP